MREVIELILDLILTCKEELLKYVVWKDEIESLSAEKKTSSHQS